MRWLSDRLMHWQLIFWVQVWLKTEVLHTRQFNPTGVRTHDLQIMTVHFISLWEVCSNHSDTSDFLKSNLLPHYLGGLRWFQMHRLSDWCTGNWYFWLKYDFGQKYYTPQVQPDWGSNSWPPDHDSTFHVTETPALTTRPSVTSIHSFAEHCMRSWWMYE